MILVTNEGLPGAGRRERPLAHLQDADRPIFPNWDGGRANNRGVGLCGTVIARQNYIWAAIPLNDANAQIIAKDGWVVCIECMLAAVLK